MMENFLKSLVEEVEREKALKEVAEATMREKRVALKVAKGRARDSEGARALAEQRVANLEAKLGEIELKLAKADSVISARDKKVADLKVEMEESENKFYDMGFADAKNSNEPIMF